MAFSICENCKNCLGGCSWAKNFTPVEGWTAEKAFWSEKYGWSYKVIFCPLFKGEPKRPKAKRGKGKKNSYEEQAAEFWSRHLERLDEWQDDLLLWRQIEKVEKMNDAAKMGDYIRCAWCGLPIRKGKRTTCCCEDCLRSLQGLKQKIRRINRRMNTTTECMVCGKTFIPSHQAMKCCSQECFYERINNNTKTKSAKARERRERTE